MSMYDSKYGSESAVNLTTSKPSAGVTGSPYSEARISNSTGSKSGVAGLLTKAVSSFHSSSISPRT